MVDTKTNEPVDISKFTKKREEITKRLERIQSFIKQFTTDQNISLIKARERIARDAFDEFTKVQEQIEDNMPLADLGTQTEIKISFENLYYDTIAAMELALETYNDQKITLNSNNTNQTPINPTENTKIKLPVISIPQFNGALEHWLSFRDVYISLIHDNKNLDKLEKMHYLKSVLSGDALRCIENLAVSASNYDQAWSLLQKRFENERLLIQTHIRKIVNSQPIAKSTSVSVRQLADDIRTNIAALKMLKRPTDKWDDILVTILTDKLDLYSSREWQNTLTDKMPTLDSLLEYLDKRCNYLDSVLQTTNTKGTQQQGQPKSTQFKQFKTVANNAVAKKSFCKICKKSNHLIYQCTNFLNLNPNERLNKAIELNLCHNCLRDNHKTENCKSNHNCQTCQSRHNTLLHININNVSNSHQNNPSTSNVNFCEHQYSENLLSTAIVLIKDASQNYHKCRILLDSGSQSNFITKNLVQLLKLKPKTVNHQIIGISEKTSNTNESVKVLIKSLHSNYTASFDCLVLNKITGELPLLSFPIENIGISKSINLADNKFNERSPVDLLVGTELFLSILKHGKTQLPQKHLYLQNSQLGWILGGRINFKNILQTSSINSLAVMGKQENLNDIVSRFWQVEGCEVNTVNKLLSGDDLRAEQHFSETFKRNADGRFVIKLPIKNSMELGNSKNVALQRFFNLEKKFTNHPQFKTDYQNFIQEYLQLGHMEIVPPDQINNDDNYYLPHHAVYKNNSSKIRVVFDASTKTTNNRSLNDNLLTGPKIQEDLLQLLIRFRTFRYVLNADITKMYRQILLDADQKDYHRIIWRDDPNMGLQTYRLTTLTYGTSCAPFIAVRCLQQLAFENHDKYPKASEVILRDFYMDDLLTGGNSLEEITTIRDQLIKILESGGFELSKWASNESKCIPNNTQQPNNSLINLDRCAETKTLGLFWNCSQDVLRYEVDSITLPSKITKRNMLATICKIFDPLGLVNPVIVKAKILLQQLWAQNLDWDKPVPNDIKSSWSVLINDLTNLNKIQISRNVLPIHTNKIEMHGFCDAPEKAYGVAIYLKTIDNHENSQIHLLIAKSRVAPLKKQSIPRLELLAAQLLAQLSHKILNTLNLEINQKYFWTDSTIVLAWLAQNSTHWQTFVANRVSEIQTLTDFKDWGHVRSADNPADIISRGSYSSQLINNNLWWSGPSWLKNSKENWPQNESQSLSPQELPEYRQVTMANVVSINQQLDILTKISKFTKLVRIFAFINRFIHNTRHKDNKRTGELTTFELNSANNTIMKIIQQNSLPQEYQQLTKNRELNKNSPIINLNPFLDSNGVIRVGGRLRNANISYDKKHPIILPNKHHVTDIIIRHYHIENLHAGTQATLASIRQSYWVISGRSKVRQILRSCIKCFRAKPTVIQQKMGDLPIQRVEPARPFLNTGVDYCGPIQIRLARERGRPKVAKAYVCIFICLCTKAVHIELVSELTSDAFLNALKRFVSRRGLVKTMMSDNATNFVKANKDLIELHNFFQNKEFQEKLISTLANNNITWSFIPPRGPNFGGLWESAVKSAKYHLKRVVGETLLTFEELYTLLTMIEACLNSRPLTPLSNDPNDVTALTPGHFLIGEMLNAPPEYDLTELKANRLSRWQLIQQMKQHFWRRWRLEYVSQLQGRNKWKSTSQSIQPGTMVIVVEDNVPPLCWPLGRVQLVHPGKDGIVRVVTVQTNKGLFKRPVSKVCALPLD